MSRHEDLRADEDERDREQRAEREADDDDDAVERHVRRVPPVLDPAGRVEVGLIRQHDGTQDRHHEVREDEILAPRFQTRNLRHEPGGHLPPVGPQVDGRQEVDAHQQAEQAEHALDPLEGQDPDDHEQEEERERDEPAVGPARKQLPEDGDAADLRRAGQEVDGVRGDERDQPGVEARALDGERRERWKDVLSVADRLRDKFGESKVTLATGMKGGFRERTHENPAGLPGKKKP